MQGRCRKRPRRSARQAIARLPQLRTDLRVRALLGGTSVEYPVVNSAEHLCEQVVNVPWRRVTAAKTLTRWGLAPPEGE